MDNPLANWFDVLSASADVVLRWLWQWPGWVWLVTGCVLAMALLIGRRLSRIGYSERSVWRKLGVEPHFPTSGEARPP